jgi:hypothetical protein
LLTGSDRANTWTARSLRSLSGSLAAAPTHRSICAPQLKKSRCHHPPGWRQSAFIWNPTLNHADFALGSLEAGRGNAAIHAGAQRTAHAGRPIHVLDELCYRAPNRAKPFTWPEPEAS